MCNRVFDVRSIVSCFNQAAVRFCRQMHRIYFGFHAHERKDVISQVVVFLQVLTSSTESSSDVHVHMHYSGWQCSHGSWKSRRLLSVLRVHSMSVWFIPLDTIRSGGWRKVFVPRFLFSQVVSHAFRIQSVCDVGSLVLRLTHGLQCWLRNSQVF